MVSYWSGACQTKTRTETPTRRALGAPLDSGKDPTPHPTLSPGYGGEGEKALAPVPGGEGGVRGRPESLGAPRAWFPSGDAKARAEGVCGTPPAWQSSHIVSGRLSPRRDSDWQAG